MDYKYLEQYVSNNLLVDLKPYIDSGDLDVSKVDAGLLSAGSVGEGVYAIAIGMNAPAMLYNKTLTDSLNITVKDNMTLDEFIAMSKEIYEKSGYCTNVSYGNGENFIDYYMRGVGIELYQGKKFGAASYEDFVPYFAFYEKGISEGWMVKPEVFAERTLGSVEQDPLVLGSNPDERSWCTMTYSNLMPATLAAASAEGIEIGISTWPSPDPVKSNYLKPSQFFSVSVNSKDPLEAVKLINFWTNSLDCNKVLLAERGVPTSSETAAALAPFLDATQQTIIKYLNEVVTPNCSRISPAAPSTSTQILTLLDQLQEQVCYGQITAEQAAQQLFDQGNAILAN